MKLFRLKESVMNGTVTMQSSESFVYASSKEALEKKCQVAQEANRANPDNPFGYMFSIEEAEPKDLKVSFLGEGGEITDEPDRSKNITGTTRLHTVAAKIMAAMGTEERLAVMYDYCRYCGIALKECHGEICHCENDE
jgi:hypothetical protein